MLCGSRVHLDGFWVHVDGKDSDPELTDPIGILVEVGLEVFDAGGADGVEHLLGLGVVVLPECQGCVFEQGAVPFFGTGRERPVRVVRVLGF